MASRQRKREQVPPMATGRNAAFQPGRATGVRGSHLRSVEPTTSASRSPSRVQMATALRALRCSTSAGTTAQHPRASRSSPNNRDALVYRGDITITPHLVGLIGFSSMKTSAERSPAASFYSTPVEAHQLRLSRRRPRRLQESILLLPFPVAASSTTRSSASRLSRAPGASYYLLPFA